MKPLELTIDGPPRTKKNDGVLDLRGPKPKKLSSKAYRAWNAQAQSQLAVFRGKYKGARLPITRPVNVAALFYREAEVGDAVGFYQALADTLQEGGIVLNDALIVSWDFTRLRKDRGRPRVELTITSAEEL